MKSFSMLRLIASLHFVLLTGLVYGQTPGTQKWVFAATGPVYYSSAAIGSDGTIYVGSRDNKLYAIKPDGSQKWAFTTLGDIDSSPSIGIDGTIYVGSDDSKLYAINPDGTKKWAFTAGNSVGSSPAIGPDGTIYVGSLDSKLYAINPNGTQKWSVTTAGTVDSSPAIGPDGTIYVGSWDMKLRAINPDGTQKWTFTSGSLIDSSPALGPDGTIYFGAWDSKLYAINPNGTQKWAFLSGSIIDSSPVIGSDGTIYFGAWDSKLYAINPNGTETWTFATESIIDGSPAIGADGTIFIGSWDSKLYAVSPNGTQKWTFATESVIDGSPTIASDGTVYIGSTDNNVYAVHSNCGGLANSPWPKHRANLRNSGSLSDLFVNTQMDFRFIASGQSMTKSFTLSNASAENIVVTGCTFDNPAFVLETQLPMTMTAGTTAQLSARIQPTRSTCYTCKGTVSYMLHSSTQTKGFDVSTGVFIEDNSESAHAAHQALDAYNSCLAKDPASLATKNNLGVLYRLLGEYNLAEQHLMQALSSSLNERYGFSGIRMNVGVVKSDKGTANDAFNFYSSSESDIATTASTSSLAPKLYYNQAWEHYKSKSPTLALAAANMTIAHQSANNYLKAKAYVLRGSIYYSIRDLANAKKDMESAKTLDPGGPIGQMADENVSVINTTDVEKVDDSEVPTDYALLTNYPNPFNPTTTIRFQLPARSVVRLLVYDVTGREIRTLVDYAMDAGRYAVRWDGEDDTGRTAPSGVYLVRMSAGHFTQIQKMILLR